MYKSGHPGKTAESQCQTKCAYTEITVCQGTGGCLCLNCLSEMNQKHGDLCEKAHLDMQGSYFCASFNKTHHKNLWVLPSCMASFEHVPDARAGNISQCCTQWIL